MRSRWVLALAVGLVGCGTPSRQEIRQDVVAARYAAAADKLDRLYDRHLPVDGDDDASGPSKHALLWRMERGTSDFIAGDFAASLDHFKPAARLGREIRTASVLRNTASYLVNDNLRIYVGEPFEHPYIPYYGMLANLFLAQRSDGSWHPPAIPGVAVPPAGAVETDPETLYDRAASAAAALEAVQRATGDEEFGSSSYHENPFLHLVAAAVRQGTARGVDDQQAAMLYAERAWRSYGPDGQIPGVARTLVARLLAGDPQRCRELTGSEPFPLPPGQGSVLVLDEVGFVAKRDALTIWVFTGASPRHSGYSDGLDVGGVFLYVDGANRDELGQFGGLLLPGQLVRSISGGRFGMFGFEMPVLPRPGQRPPVEQLLFDAAQRQPFERVDDVEAHARRCFDDHKAKRLITILARTVAKLVAAHFGVDQVQIHGRHSAESEIAQDLLWLVSSALVTVSEQADTRCWTLLPKQIDGALIDLPAGVHQLRMQHSDGGIRDLGSVEVRPGRLLVLSSRSFPAGYDHAGKKD